VKSPRKTRVRPSGDPAMSPFPSISYPSFRSSAASSLKHPCMSPITSILSASSFSYMRDPSTAAIVPCDSSIGLQFQKPLVSETVVPDHIPVPVRALFQYPLLRFVIDVYDPESLAVAVCPFKVIQQRPNIISFDVHTGADRAVHLRQVPVKVIHAVVILDLSLAVDDVIESRAVFGDEDLDPAVVPVEADKQVMDTFGIDL